ncbi:MAG: hypothetical protein GY938_29525, partial [Ketobacter sp.]|nr:hypothetical protein [Ketobacter sp.]
MAEYLPLTVLPNGLLQPVLSMAMGNKISEEDYFNAVEKLARANFFYVSLGVPLLVHTFENKGWSIDREVELTLKPIRDAR